MKRKVVDVSKLPTIGFGARDPLWWGVMLMICIEGTMLILLTISHFYVRDRTNPFPPTQISRDLAWLATVEVVLWIASIFPMRKATNAAIAGDLEAMRFWLIITTLVGLAAGTLRWWIMGSLPFRWDSHAYGSVVWALLGMQWIHQLTGIGENLVYITLFFKGPVEEKHRVDIEVSGPLWYFIVAGAVLAYAVVFIEVFGKGHA